MIDKMKRNSFCAVLVFLCGLAVSCSSVFYGGVSGRVVDAESTSNPKAGIPDVEVYVYTEKSERNSDFNKWNKTDRFSPASSYYARTTTGSDGSFLISKVMWKEMKPDFGKDGDVSEVYLLFYHENYGLVKGGTLIVSDSTSDSIYQEMKKVKVSTDLELSIIDVADNSYASEPVHVKVTVPQIWDSGSESQDLVKDGVIMNGVGTVSVSYPRESNPEITIEYCMSGDEENFKACKNNTAENDYAFLSVPAVKRNLNGEENYSVHLYGKKTRLSVPTVNGTYGDSAADDGKVIRMMASLDDGATYVLDCGEVTTEARALGTNGNQTHGNFSGLGQNVYFRDESYTGKFVELKVKLFEKGNESSAVEKTLRTDTSVYNVKL